MRRVALFLGALALAIVALWVLPPSDPRPVAGGLKIDPPTSAESIGVLSGPERRDRSPVVDDAGAAIPDGREETRDPNQAAHVGRRIEVVDIRGDPVSSAVAIHKNSTGDLIGFPADAQGWIEIPLQPATDDFRVAAAGYHPTVLHGILQEERVVLAEAIRVQVQITDGWQLLTEGWPGFQIKSGFKAQLEPPRAPGFNSSEDSLPYVAVRSKDGSKELVGLADLEAVLFAEVSPEGLATFWVLERGEYSMKLTWEVITSEKPSRTLICAFSPLLEIVVRSDETDQYFQVPVPQEKTDLLRQAFEESEDQ